MPHECPATPHFTVGTHFTQTLLVHVSPAGQPPQAPVMPQPSSISVSHWFSHAFGLQPSPRQVIEWQPTGRIFFAFPEKSQAVTLQLRLGGVPVHGSQGTAEAGAGG